MTKKISEDNRCSAQGYTSVLCSTKRLLSSAFRETKVKGIFAVAQTVPNTVI